MVKLKKPLTYEEQVERLKNHHGLEIFDDGEAKKILSEVSYYRLSAYAIGLMRADDCEKVQEGISLNHIFALYQFDSKLRALLYRTIEFLEIKFRTQIAYYIAMHYGAEGYTDSQNFETVCKQNGESVFDGILKRFNEEKTRQSNLPIVQHHENKYAGHYPVWVALELFTFGNLVSLYSIMKTEDRKNLARLYYTDEQRLKSWVLALVEMRNICAHYGRIYNMPLKQRPKLYKEHAKYPNTVTKLFPLLIAIRRMLSGHAEWESFYQDLVELLENHKDVVRLSFIGFPKNWAQILKLESNVSNT